MVLLSVSKSISFRPFSYIYLYRGFLLMVIVVTPYHHRHFIQSPLCKHISTSNDTKFCIYVYYMHLQNITLCAFSFPPSMPIFFFYLFIFNLDIEQLVICLPVALLADKRSSSKNILIKNIISSSNNSIQYVFLKQTSKFLCHYSLM